MTAELVLYWPGAILFWVGLKLVAHVRAQTITPKPALFSSRETAVLVAVILVGSSITVAANISSPIGRFFGVESPNDVWEITGGYYRYAEHREIEASSGSFVDIFNLYGDVQIIPSTDSRVILDVNKSVRASSQEEADMMAESFSFEVTPKSASIFSIRSRRDEDAAITTRTPLGKQRQRYKSSLIVRVPAHTSVRLENHGGNIDISGVTGDQEVHNSFGSVAMRGIVGSVRVENPDGAIDLEDISSHATITRGFESLKTRNIRGALSTVGN